ncbi:MULTISPECIES: tape measure protein [unclassified Acinetobacter]|uniref:tape measure protein n=1 Tax=unclassified Acinetobacter TaxID=196816 RepID=UPI002448FCC7|nr:MULTISPECIES: tape measure protein [unclassified Acinetobacter]MDH0031328.1 tape measure protein [Acinetobacter sp. GD04021]MDH0887187.1 tape measure protein [Acinetobacter sp. GD03873]MDH1083524.1 tape measure protein [Acinetobacter sp. GD03983]MDH2190503.1 tape measure protein [Acinetobacter sp. GD03645]MDH2204051.1 tape measure protein [Acinetobacter sp. GD03647]
MSKELVFKVVLQADTKDYVSNVKQSEDVTKAIVKTIKDEAEKLKEASEQAGKEVGKIVPDDLKPKADDAKTAVLEVSKAADELEKQSGEASAKVADLGDKLKETGNDANIASKNIGEVVPESTTKMATALTQNLTNATAAIKGAGTNAGETAKNFNEFGQVSEKALGVLKSDLDQAKQKLQAFSTTNAKPQDIEAAQRAVDQLEKEVEQADQAFNNFTQASSKANQELRETEATSDKAQVGFSVLKTTIGTLTAGLAALGLGLTINELIATSDATQQMASRLRNATDSVEEYNQVQSRLLELANATFRPLAEAQEVYLATAGTMKSLGYSTNEVLTLTDSLALSFTHNATRADQAQSAQDALAQSLAKGSVDADAWMSIITGADNVVGDLARSTGRTESEIRKLGAEGKISVNELTKALIESRDRNVELASAMENSTADAMQQVRNNITALIGQMNEQYNISSRLAGVIQSLGGDLDWIAVLFDDVMSAVDALSEEFESIDPTIFESLKQAISSTYDAVKQIGIGLYELGEISIKQLNDGLNNIVAVLGSFTGEATKAGDQVSFLTRTAQGLSITFGAISDMVFALRLVVMTLAGVFYDLGVVINGVLATITFGDVSDQFAANAEKMRLKAKQFYDDVDQLALAHESQAKKRLDEAVESEGQKNARILAENKKALDDLLAIQEQEGQNSDKLQSRKLKAVTDYATEAVQANSGVLSSALELELAQKGYFATVDQGGKVVVTRLTEAEQATAAATLEIKRQEQAFKNASETGQALGVDVQQVTNKISAGFSDNSGKLTAFVGQLKDAGITGTQASDMIYQAWQKWLSQAKNTAEIDEAKKKLMEMGVAGQVTGEQLDAGFKLASEAARDLDPALNDAREAGKALGIDIDKTANFMSQGFGQGSANLDTLKQKLEEAGIKGREASNILYQGWKTWLEKADSQVELDAAKAKFKEFEAQGVFSAKQVENGMLALEIQTSKVKGETDETTEAFKRLGIQTKEQLSLAAKQAMMDFEQVKNSGQATAEGTKQAYEKMSQAVALSGDQAIIAQAKAVGASNGLNMEIDKTGKAVVKTTQEIVDALYPIGSAAESATGRAAQGFRDLGRTAREEAQSSADAWAKAMEEVAAKRAAQTAVTAKGLSELQGGIDQMSEDYFNRLVAAGMDSSRARDLADKAKLSLAQETTDALRGGNQLGVNTTKQQMEKTLAYWENKNSSTGASISLGGNTPVISAPNIEPPQIQQIRMPNIDSGPDKNVRIELAIGNSKSELYGTQAQVDATEELFRQLEEAKKRS